MKIKARRRCHNRHNHRCKPRRGICPHRIWSGGCQCYSSLPVFLDIFDTFLRAMQSSGTGYTTARFLPSPCPRTQRMYWCYIIDYLYARWLLKSAQKQQQTAVITSRDEMSRSAIFWLRFTPPNTTRRKGDW